MTPYNHQASEVHLLNMVCNIQFKRPVSSCPERSLFCLYADKDPKDLYVYRAEDGSLMVHRVDTNVTELLVDKSIFVSQTCGLVLSY
jgi:hypothetical protein